MSWTTSVACATFFFFFSISSLELSDTQVDEPHIRARLGTASNFCQVVVLILRLRDQLFVVLGFRFLLLCSVFFCLLWVHGLGLRFLGLGFGFSVFSLRIEVLEFRV